MIKHYLNSFSSYFYHRSWLTQPLFGYLSVCLSVCLSVRLSICLSVCSPFSVQSCTPARFLKAIPLFYDEIQCNKLLIFQLQNYCTCFLWPHVRVVESNLSAYIMCKDTLTLHMETIYHLSQA